MTLLLVVVLMAVGVAGAGSAGASSAVPSAALTITYWPDEQKPAELERWTLRCNPVAGTLPNRARACRKLARTPLGAFAQVPPSAVCTQIYGGPQKAVVKGRIGTHRIWASFRRRNGCEIDRWDRFSPWLLPPGGVTG